MRLFHTVPSYLSYVTRAVSPLGERPLPTLDERREVAVPIGADLSKRREVSIRPILSPSKLWIEKKIY